jgi:hypothetical protein
MFSYITPAETTPDANNTAEAAIAAILDAFIPFIFSPQWFFPVA